LRVPGEVAFGWFDLDDVGTEVVEIAAGDGAGQHSREIEDGDALERTGGHRVRLR
jgi:hypothetical protein